MMGITADETVSDVLAAWNEDRAKSIEEEEGGGTLMMSVLATSVWMDRLFHAHLRERNPPKRGRGPAKAREVTPNGNGPQKVE